MKSSQLQSLSRRVKNAIAAIHVEIRLEAMTLTGMADIDKPIYGQLSRLQAERKKLEKLQIALKKDLKARFTIENAARVLRASKWHGNMLMADLNNMDDL